MRVSTRHAIPALAIILGGMTAPAVAFQDPCCTPPPPPPCCTHGHGHTVNVPNINIHGGNINVGVNVSANVNVTANVNASAAANASAGANAAAGAITYVGGGSYYAPATAPAATAITGLNVVGREEEYELYEEERTRTVEEWRVVRAVCVDDTGTPHPASRVDAAESVDATYSGEIFRCVAGTALQATIGWRTDGQDIWEDASTIMCRKGEALGYAIHGQLTCATQVARRNCNERSLLRRHGPGVKLVMIRRQETYTESLRRERYASREVSMTLMLDGGVGGYR
ncbi:MAG: hypothetical protein P8P99_03860 [Maricaulis sp.]|nr:hypothetical protein [Maricaulis sp.]